MEFTIYRDLASLAFVRCISPIPGTKIYAEGTGFSVTRAIAKCRSESIESQFQLSHPLCAKMLGIAAHPAAEESLSNAWNETLETRVLEQLEKSPVFYGLPISLFQVKLGLGVLALHIIGTREAPPWLTKEQPNQGEKDGTYERRRPICRPA